MQPERVRNLAQHQRPHRDFAVLEEMALLVDDRLRYAQDGVEALLHVLDQPARFLQLGGDGGAAGARSRRELGVQAVDAQARHGVRIEARAPDAAQLAHDDVGNHVARLHLGVGGARAGIERLDQALRRAQRLLARAGDALEARVIAARKQPQMFFHDVEREAARRLIGHDAQLQREALPGGARAHAGGLQVLQVPERDAELFEIGFGFGGQQRRDFLERLRQIAVFVEGVDQQLDEYAVAIAQIGERELAAQVIAQRRRVRRGKAAVALVIVIRPAPAGGDIRRPVGVGGGGFGAAARARAARGRRRGCRGLGLAFGILALERRVLHQHAVDLLVELDRRQLQQADRLLQLRS